LLMKNKAIFLDRDDTLIEDPGYISHPDQVKLLDGVAEALIDLKAMGYKLVIVSNQSAVARGIITEQSLEDIHEKLRQELAERGAFLDRIYYCPFHPEGVIPKYRKESDYRKPNSGMLLAAAKEMKIDLNQSWMIGNSSRDIQAGLRAGCKTILIQHSLRPKLISAGEPRPDYYAVNLRESVNIIKKHLRSPIRQMAPVTVMPEPQYEIAQPVLEEPVVESLPKESQIEQQQIYEESVNEPEPENEIEEENNKYGSDKIEEILRGILEQLKRMQRQEMFGEFSIMRFLAGLAQIIVIGCLLVGVWLLMSPVKQDNSILISLGFAAVLQLIALTFYIMQGRK
jgi:D-glycero-D-manno-heptose 1,7-bisphosphate phosphatase